MPSLQLSRSGLNDRLSPSDLAAASHFFRKNHYVKFRGFLDDGLKKFIRNDLLGSSVGRYEDTGGSERELQNSKSADLLFFLMNDPKLLKRIEKITDSLRIHSFYGRCYQLDPDFNDYMGWHDDVRDARRVGATINLSSVPYSGGTLEMRTKGKTRARALLNKTFGDLLIFKISPKFEHCITPVRGTRLKTALSGWFRSSKESFLNNAEVLKNKRALWHAPETFTIRLSRAVTWRREKNRTLILDVSQRKYYRLNPTAADIWHMITQKRPVNFIIKKLQEDYQVPEKKLVEETRGFISALYHSGIVQS